jgi:hypothetical protein
LIICLVPVHFGFRLNSSFRPAAAAVLEMTWKLFSSIRSLGKCLLTDC